MSSSRTFVPAMYFISSKIRSASASPVSITAHSRAFLFFTVFPMSAKFAKISLVSPGVKRS